MNVDQNFNGNLIKPGDPVDWWFDRSMGYRIHEIFSDGKIILVGPDGKLHDAKAEHLILFESLSRGTKVRKSKGDYHMDAIIVCSYQRLSDKWHYIVEDERGLNLIWSREQFEVVP